MQAEVRQIGNCMVTGKRSNPNQGRVYDSNGLCPALNCMRGGHRQPMVIVAAQRGRMYRGQPQRLEPRFDGLTNSITTVAKDNYLLEICGK